MDLKELKVKKIGKQLKWQAILDHGFKIGARGNAAPANVCDMKQNKTKLFHCHIFFTHGVSV